MKTILLAVGVLACGGGAFFHLNRGPDAMETLLQVPANAGNGGYGWIDPAPPIDDWAQPGRHTVIVFSADWCPGCKKMQTYLKQFHARYRPDVAVRMVDVTHFRDMDDANARYGTDIGAVPSVRVYGPDGQLLAADEGRDGREGCDLLLKWMNKERRLAAAANRGR